VLVLKSVILGPLATTEDVIIQERLAPVVAVDVIHSRMAFRSFRIVRNKRHLARKLKGAEHGAPADRPTAVEFRVG